MAVIRSFLTFLTESDDRLHDIDYKLSTAKSNPFYRIRVRVKKEIVTIGLEDDPVDPTSLVGEYVDPDDWNAIISDPDTVVIDTRNEYEVKMGTFRGALNPHTDSFREFPSYIKEHFSPASTKKVAMFCTGGIRCEKASAYMLKAGFEKVYHLKGGILKYLETVDEKKSLWDGECFVFDERVSVGHNLTVGDYEKCYACRAPLSASDKSNSAYVEGVSCAQCIDKTTEEQKQKYRERQHQIELHRDTGRLHIGKVYDTDHA